MIPEKAPVFSGMNHPCQTDRDINLQIVPEDQITGLRVLSLRWKLLKRIVIIEVIRCKDNIAILCIILGHFFFIAKKLELSREMRGISNFLLFCDLTMEAAPLSEGKTGNLMGGKQPNQILWNDIPMRSKIPVILKNPARQCLHARSFWSRVKAKYLFFRIYFHYAGMMRWLKA